ncbi:MAG: hypothetical protein IKO34_00545 [Bacteroidales bacterium]|jgi:hypothetical protein|nr:hypothetical protein [Bacteroidales bacterium]
MKKYVFEIGMFLIVIGAIVLLYIRQYKMQKNYDRKLAVVSYNMDRIHNGEAPANETRIEGDSISFYLDGKLLGSVVISEE